MRTQRNLPIVDGSAVPASIDIAGSLTELQALGMRWRGASGLHRLGGAGPSDHKAIRLAGQTVMVPILTHAAAQSPFEAIANGDRAELRREGALVAEITFPPIPRFYELETAEGVPYWKIATLHSHDVFATTVLQNCVRYADRRTSCQFCAIGQSLRTRSTIARKTPAQLAEVAAAAVRLDGVRHGVLTTGTPPTADRGAAILCEAAAGIRGAVELPLQAQCEPPDDFAWFERLRSSGVDTLGMHLEAVTEAVRAEIMPGKAEVSIETYLDAFDAAVEVFGRGQVTTYVLAGLGDPEEAILRMAEEVARRGVYPFVVPFVPIAGTPFEHHPTPSPFAMQRLLDGVARILEDAGLRSQDIAAGCGRCGACSTLRSREKSAEVGA